MELDKVRRVEYNMRKFDHQETKERAKTVIEKGLKVPYRLFSRNCETFATICVVGNDNIDTNLSHSTSHQGRSWFSGAVHCVCLGSRFITSFISFFLYITFIAGDNIIDIIPKSSAAIFSEVCKLNASTAIGARDHRICHLRIQSIFIGAYIIYLISYVTYKCKAKFTCRRCKTKSFIVTLSRFLLYCLLEFLLIAVEPFVFTKIKSWLFDSIKNPTSLRQFILVVVAFVKSAIECTLIYWLSNAIAKFIPKYLVSKKPLEGTGSVHKGDVISWNRGIWQCSVDAIVTNVHAANNTIDLIYEESCSWTLFCTQIVKECIPIDLERMKVYDFSDFSHKYSPEDVVSNAENQLGKGDVRCTCGFFCFNRSSNFCYSAKVKDISCPERFNSCEKCVRCVCCFWIICRFKHSLWMIAAPRCLYMWKLLVWFVNCTSHTTRTKLRDSLTGQKWTKRRFFFPFTTRTKSRDSLTGQKWTKRRFFSNCE